MLYKSLELFKKSNGLSQRVTGGAVSVRVIAFRVVCVSICMCMCECLCVYVLKRVYMRGCSSLYLWFCVCMIFFVCMWIWISESYVLFTKVIFSTESN